MSLPPVRGRANTVKLLKYVTASGQNHPGLSLMEIGHNHICKSMSGAKTGLLRMEKGHQLSGCSCLAQFVKAAKVFLLAQVAAKCEIGFVTQAFAFSLGRSTRRKMWFHLKTAISLKSSLGKC